MIVQEVVECLDSIEYHQSELHSRVEVKKVNPLNLANMVYQDQPDMGLSTRPIPPDFTHPRLASLRTSDDELDLSEPRTSRPSAFILNAAEEVVDSDPPSVLEASFLSSDPASVHEPFYRVNLRDQLWNKIFLYHVFNVIKLL
jgi:hypothetical protein